MPATPNNLSLNFTKSNYNVFGTKINNASVEQQQEQKTELLEGTRGNGLPHLKNGVDYVNPGEEDQMEIYGYKRNKAYTAITWFLILVSGGLLRLVFHWVPQLMLYATHSKCPVEEAETVLLKEQFQGKHSIYHVKKIKTVLAQDIWKNCRSETIEELAELPTKLNDSRSEIAISIEPEQDEEQTPMPMSFHLSGGHFKEVPWMYAFTCKKLTYIWEADRGEYMKLRGLDTGVVTSSLHQMSGLSAAQQFMRRGVYGANEIVVPVSSLLTLILLEVLNPFYVFQIFSFALWISDNYIYYALVILSMSVCGVIMASVQTRRNQRNLSSTVSSSDVVTVLRDRATDKTMTIPAKNLVPGDILVIPSYGCVLPCDAVLITGNCILNESMLTGESVPVTKTPIPAANDVIYDGKEHARHTLYCGTKVLQTRYFGTEKVLAVVIRTGYNTSKGGLVRSIMYPPPVDFKFEQDSYKFVIGLACIAVVGAIYTVISKVMNEESPRDIALEALDLITIVVPPALPAAMTVGRLVAQSRLKKFKIFCTSPRAINVSGSIDCVCFDKTGTLTEDGLDMWGVVSVTTKKFQLPCKEITSLPLSEVLIGMVTCHSITIIDGQLIGDPLDLKMFESTGWILEEPNVSDTSKFSMLFPTVVRPPDNSSITMKNLLKSHDSEDHGGDESLTTSLATDELADDGVVIGIVRQFPFTSSLQRMSVITRTLGADHYDLYCKGSPEMILSLSKPESVPHDFNSVLQEYTSEGYRVIALAYKSLKRLPYAKVQRITRETAETELNFLGFVILENRLKPETMPVIAALNEAAIKVVMVTGDNMLTALSVARDCDIVKPGVPVIAVTAVSQPNHAKPTLYFSRSYTQGSQGQSSPTPLAGEGDFSEITDINSVVSLETIESGGVYANNNHRAGAVMNYISDDIEKNGKVQKNSRKNDYVFSLTGKTWATIKQYYPELIPKISTRGTIFARMSPDQKQQLVQELQALGYYVAMVGDGANDCGALKAAHTGISLSDTESSVASPFTSRDTNISCVLSVIREGRAALVTSFGIFKYMAGYSLIQFVSVLLLYSIGSNLTDIEFLYIDLFIISIFAFFFGKTKAYEGPLHKNPPLTSLMSATPILSLTLQIALVGIFQYLSLFSLRQTADFKPFQPKEHEDKDDVGCMENYTIFIMSSLQYIIMAVVFSKGRPYRQPMYTNYGLLGSFIVLTMFSAYITLIPFQQLAEWFELVLPPEMTFRCVLLAYGLANFVLAMVVELFVVDYIVVTKLKKKLHNVDKSRRKFLQYDRDMSLNTEWPPLTQEPLPESAPDILIRQNQVTEIKIEKRESVPSDYVVGAQTTTHRRGSPPSLPPDCMLPFKNFERNFGSTREVPLNPRSLCEDPRNSVSMKTVLNFQDDKLCIMANDKPRLNFESTQDIDCVDKINRIKETNLVATLPRHSAAVNAIGIEEKKERIGTMTQSVLELDVLPS
ncbi:cation-transporting ATPase 13A2 isoform X1 [Trichogramma pretiosum]|uniref:cation-transporting ATPase 13A2 isoform X1 n=1 Tax=Trichogramma pretiosum TaxID=7493 RepID=UPI0006C97507|nr:cation-transporting ATPase 13A2 isoform X1 [Trichogramma pretiosum]XP_023317068.1 cation-transporting ATPase 13A2 isoform X1 [Trichogramma pretiosum]XP_023317069.1 cation-transporting ATPase 13A2 isoform X1 [Trichogramma pretiosum]